MGFFVDSSLDLEYEDNIPKGEDAELSAELVKLFVDLFGGEVLERCSDLFESIDGQAS